MGQWKGGGQHIWAGGEVLHLSPTLPEALGSNFAGQPGCSISIFLDHLFIWPVSENRETITSLVDSLSPNGKRSDKQQY